MPERSLAALDADRHKKAVEYVPGYDWIPGMFGPPPGIPKAYKDKLGRYMHQSNSISFSNHAKISNF